MKYKKMIVMVAASAVCFCLWNKKPVMAEELGSFSSGTFYMPEKNTVQESEDSYLTPKFYQAGSSFTDKIVSNYKVKNQGSYSTCWAFSLASAAEINLVKKGVTTDFLDLSESHLAYFFFNRVSDKWSRTSGDKVNYIGPGSYLKLGNDSKFAITALANWTGFADELDGPYSKVKTSKKAFDKLSKKEKVAMQMKDKVHLNNAEIVNPKNISLIKKKLAIYGAATTGFYYNANNYDDKHISYNNASSVSGNHAVTIVGYDDNYSRKNFKKTPKKDGAWLVLNSWGSEWGDNGYFWLSYYDASLDNFNFIDVSLADDYDTVYQYDGTSGISYRYATKNSGCANVFTTSSSIETLDAVSFYTLQDNMPYKIKIYSDVKSTSDKGTLIKTLTGKATSAGYHTVRLPQPILLDPKTKFAVEVDYCKNYAAIPFDYSYTVSMGTTPVIQFIATAKKGQSYTVSSNGKWTDSPYNYRVKAFTTNTAKRSNTKETTSIELYYKNQKIKTITRVKNWNSYFVSPYTMKGYEFGGWYQDASLKKKVTCITLNKPVIRLYAKETVIVGKTYNVSVSKYSKTSITLKWKKASNAKQYEVYEYDTKKKAYKKIKTLKGTALTIKNRKANTSSRYKVRAVNGSVKGSCSSVITAHTTLTTPKLKKTTKNRVSTIKVEKNKSATYVQMYIKTQNGSYKLMKTTKVKNGKASKATVKIKRNKTYYVKLKTYTVHNNKKYYSDFSKSIKISKSDKIMLTS